MHSVPGFGPPPIHSGRCRRDSHKAKLAVAAIAPTGGSKFAEAAVRHTFAHVYVSPTVVLTPCLHADTRRVENEDTQAEIKRVKANNLDLTSRLAESEAALKARTYL